MRHLQGAIFAVLAILLMGTMSSPRWGAAWEDTQFPATLFLLPSSSPPALVPWVNDGDSSNGVFVLEFEDQAVNEEQVPFDAQMQHSWLEGSTIHPHIHYSPEDATSCNYRVCIEYLIASAGSNFAATTSELCKTFASSTVALEHTYQDIGDITMAGHTISAMVKGRLFRNSSDAADTCDSKALYLHGFDIHYQIDRPGSRAEDTK